MRNLKKLFAVLLAVAMIATMMVPALAAVTYQSEALSLQAIKVFAGGPDDLKLEEGVTRAQGLAFAIRVAGKEKDALAMTDADVDAILADWVDASELTGGAAWARKYLAYAIKNEMTVGVGGNKLAALENITGTSLMVFVMKAMGYSEATTANIATLVVEKGMMSAGDAAKFADIQSGLVRDDAAGILYNAFANGVNNDGTKLIDSYIASGATTEADAAAAGFVEVLDAVTVTAVGARKLEVKFNKAVDSAKAVIEAKRGTVKPSVKEIKWAEDKKSAVIEFSTDMAAGDYTVTVTGLTEEALTATTKVEAAKLTTIRFLSDVVIRNTDGSAATTTVVAENQYGEDVSAKLASVSINSSKGDATVNNKGLVTLDGDAGDFKVDEKVVVTIVDSQTATVATKTLTIASAAAVESIEFGTLTTDDDDLKGKEINVTAMTDNAGEYYLPITVKDQYGNVLEVAELAGFDVMSSNENIVKLANAEIVDTDDGTVIKFQDTGKSVSGTVVITAVATGTGKSANTTIVVKDDAKIDTVTMSAPETELKIDIAAVLPVEVLDTYGEEISLNDAVAVQNNDDELLFKDGVTKISATHALLKVEKDYVKNVTTIKVTPEEKNVILTVTTANGKYQSLTLTANDKPVVTSIKGLKADFASMLANDSTLSTDLADNIVFLDQYGEEIKEADFVDSYFTVTATDAGNNKTTLDGLVINSSANAGTETYAVKLFDVDDAELDVFEFVVTVVDKTKITEFGVEDLNKFYTGDPAGADYNHDQDIEVYGLVNGKKVVINQDMVKFVSGLDGVDLYENTITGEIKVMYVSTGTVDTDGKDKEGKISLLIDNGKATYTITKDISYSDAAPAAASLIFEYDGDEVKADTISVADEDDYLDNLWPVAKDQYGVEVPFNTVVYKLVVTNVVENDASEVESFQLNVFINGIYKTIKVIYETPQA